MKQLKFPIAIFLLVIMSSTAIIAQDNAPITSGDANPISVKNSSNVKPLISLAGDIQDVSVSPDNSMMAVINEPVDFTFTISIFALDSGIKIASMQGGMDFFFDLVWSPDSRKIALISRRTNGSGEEWVVMTYTVELGADFRHYLMGGDNFFGDFVRSPDDPGTLVRLAWSPDSTMIAVSYNERLDIYDVNANKLLVSLPSRGVQSIEWTNDSRFIITRSGQVRSYDLMIKLWGIKTSSN